jgi:hypothetical protein
MNLDALDMIERAFERDQRMRLCDIALDMVKHTTADFIT